ncbi:uncharacterized protein LOC111705042 [Eurytemora carolleeae]|uniref:uncharacterized protein LOC111705042 n=1 Tax=Eurytemora carolleeae TaxID=1294199 RepID=UPI000C760A78|nr:uncharacterized protein LOC111705042 [Eurytemora carolleeae]|eukprot:XP_023333237.1 uncharacterized protein LOC111705042 [Eurytemora affinis]
MPMTRHQSADGYPESRKSPNASAAVSADCLRVHGYLGEDDTQDLIDEYQQSINEQATLITEDSVFFESSSPVSFEFSDSKVGSSAEKIVRYTKLCSHHVNSEKTIQEGDQIMESNITSDSISPLLQTPPAVLRAVSHLQLHLSPTSQSRITTPTQLCPSPSSQSRSTTPTQLCPSPSSQSRSNTPIQLNPGTSCESRRATPIQLRALTSTSSNQIYPVYGDQV